MNRSFVLSVALTGACALSGLADASSFEATLLYTFVGTDGEPVSTVVNQGSAGETFVGTASAASGASVTYSDDVPAKYLCADVHAATALSEDWKSICFATNGAGHGAIVRTLGLGPHICEAAVDAGFTIEFFVKFEKAQSWKDFCKFWYQSASSNSQQAKYVLWDSKAGLQMNSSNPTTKTLSPGTWYHLAAVYTPADGNWRMYCNGGLFATQTGEIKGASSYAQLDIGGEGTAYENFAGKIAAFRVTPAALTTDGFMRARNSLSDVGKEGLLGFWAFKDGQPGDPAKICTKDSGDPFEQLMGAALGGGAMPVFSDDVPGPVVFESVTNHTPIATGAQSVKFAGSSDNCSGGKLTFPALCSRLVAAGAFTIEFFAKLDESYTWRNFFAMSLNGSQYVKLANRKATELATQIGSENAASIPYTWIGAWHHVAFEWDADSQEFSSYVDHQKVKTISGISLSGAADGYFGCHYLGRASELMNGKLFGLRISTKRLDPLDMLAVGPEPVPEHAAKTVFHWDFEDSGAQDGQSFALTGARPVHAGHYNGMGTYSNSRNPSYSAEVPSPSKPYTVQGRDIVTTNRFSAHFWGYSTTYNNSWSGSRLENVRSSSAEDVRTRPESFTLEFFIRRDTSEGMKLTGANGQLLAAFGSAGIDTGSENSDWYMYFAPSTAYATSPLFLHYYDDAGQYHSRDLGFGLLDGGWHHLALVYDAKACVFDVYLDRENKSHWDVSAAPMRRTLDKSWRHVFGRGFNTSGFNGWLDDIRLTDGVLQPSQFLRKGTGPCGTLIILR